MRPRAARPTHEWGRRKLLALLLVAAAGLIASLVGLGLAVYYSVIADEPSDSAERERHEAPAIDESEARPGQLSTREFEVLHVPAATRPGPAGVATGFPRTPEGALAQLAAIGQTTLQSASISSAQGVIRHWAAAGGPTPESWSGVRAVSALLTSAGVTDGSATMITVSADPRMGLIRAADDNNVEACVDYVVTATLTKTASVAAADCQRLTWLDRRWVVAPGPEPDQAPSVWPGTEAAYQVGYRVLRDE